MQLNDYYLSSYIVKYASKAEQNVPSFPSVWLIKWMPVAQTAFQVNGQTIHSALGIPATHGSFVDLSDSHLWLYSSNGKGYTATDISTC